MAIWRINLKPGAEENVDPRAFCIGGNFLGVGWPVDGGFNDMDWETYERLGMDKYYSQGDKGWWPALNAIRHRMAIGDLCYTRDTNGKYFLGKITGDWRYCGRPENVAADIVNVRDCLWVPIGSIDAVPGKVLNSFRPSRTVQTVYDRTAEFYSSYLYSKLSGSGDFAVPDNINLDLFSLVSPEDCEDFVGLFLQVSLGYRLIPSTCKRDTPKTEFVLKRDGDETAYVQVKQGEAINRDLFDLPNRKIRWFLFSTAGEYEGTADEAKVCLCPEDIRRFVLEHREVMSDRVRYYLDILEECA